MRIVWTVLMLAAVDGAGSPAVRAQAPPLTACEPVACIRPEQRSLQYRSPDRLCRERTPTVARDISVQHPGADRPTYLLSLDEAIQLALQNDEVIRIVAGTTAVSSGSTVYDAAITNTAVDVARGRFDPVLNLESGLSRVESPQGVFDPLNPSGATIEGFSLQSNTRAANLAQTKPGGGTGRIGYATNPTNPIGTLAPLDPQYPTAVTMSYTQPLLRGRGVDVNQAPIVIAKIDTERSFYQLKDSVQEQIRSVIEAYWNIVSARTTVWARHQQVEQLQYAYNFFHAQLQAGRGDLGDTAQAEVSLANFRASLISAEADLINLEEALLNALGLPPGCDIHFVPSTEPTLDRSDHDLQSLVNAAEANRPDIAQAKLILEADCQRLLVAENNAQSQVDATALYRWNGLRGNTPSGDNISTQFGQFADWQMGLVLDVPLGLRSGRASLRQVELLLARDKANLQQSVHAATHEVARSLRNLDQFFAQYEAFQAVRKAALLNLKRQFEVFRAGGVPTDRIIYLNVLQAVTDWGNAVSNEALSVSQFNSELARLARVTGTILEEHGIHFLEERYASIGPKLLGECPCYPEAQPPSPAAPRYGEGDQPAEEAFELQSPVPKPKKRSKTSAAPAPNEGQGGERQELPRPPGSDSDSPDARPTMLRLPPVMPANRSGE